MGRTFMIVTYEKVPNPKFNENDLTTWMHSATITARVETPHVVDDGLWVAEAFSGGCFTNFFLGSTEPPEGIALEQAEHGCHMLYVSPEPFGVISAPGTLEGIATGGRYFRSARQIRGGKLGQYVPIPKLKFAREANGVAKPWVTKPRDNRRTHIGWGLLPDLVKASGLTIEQLLLGFWPFVNFQYDPTSWRSDSRTLDLLVDYTREQIHNQPPIQPRRLTQDTIKQALYCLDGWNEPWDRTWVRKGYANTVLRLLELGYQPASVPARV
jgi:hypothetical protein